MAHWLMKSEPDAFSIDDLMKSPNQTTPWNGVRNYQARNFMYKEMRVGDKVLFYHSNCNPPGIVGTAVIASEAYPDDTQWNKKSPYYDSKSTLEEPRWFMVDVKFVKKFPRMISLPELRETPALEELPLLRKGNRLSIQPITARQWELILKLL